MKLPWLIRAALIWAGAMVSVLGLHDAVLYDQQMHAHSGGVAFYVMVFGLAVFAFGIVAENEQLH